MDLKKLIDRFSQFGGLKLVCQYAKLGVLPVIIKGVAKCIVKKQSFKIIYPEVLTLIEPFLISEYKQILDRSKELYSKQVFEKRKSNIVWFCWLQGLNMAPNIVKTCYNSLKQCLLGRDIKVIDDDNWKDYIEFPNYIVKKWDEKMIPAALFSDLLRIQLLIKYGGTWIDSTVLCTKKGYYPDYFDADLFLFQYTQPRSTTGISISNWFITSHSNNEVLMVLRDMLFAYWKDYNCTLDYYVFHLFFKIVAEEYPEQVASMPYGSSMSSLALLHHWGEKFDRDRWEKLTAIVSFHKLAFRVSDDVLKDKDNYYNFILNAFLQNN